MLKSLQLVTGMQLILRKSTTTTTLQFVLNPDFVKLEQRMYQFTLTEKYFQFWSIWNLNKNAAKSGSTFGDMSPRICKLGNNLTRLCECVCLYGNITVHSINRYSNEILLAFQKKFPAILFQL